MIIKRTFNEKVVEIKLTADELAEAHKQYIVNWMESVILDETKKEEVPDNSVHDVALSAYDIYCDEEGLTEYEAVQKAIERYQEENRKVKQFFKNCGTWTVQCKTKTPFKAMTVNVGFLKDDKTEDETQFDINAFNVDELDELFHTFCMENNFSVKKILYLNVVQTADTIEKLEN